MYGMRAIGSDSESDSAGSGLTSITVQGYGTRTVRSRFLLIPIF